MNPSRIRVAIADDHQMIRIGLERVIAFMADMSVVAQFTDANEVLRADLGVVDVLILDMNMPGSDGISLISTVTARYPDLKVVVFSMLPEESFAPRALTAGAAAYLNKNQSPEEVMTAIQIVVSREGKYISRDQQDSLLALEADAGAPLHQSLSPREFDILRLIADGHKPTGIAEQLGLKIGTVTTHIHRVKRKLGAHSLGDLVTYAHRHQLIGG